MSNTSTRIVHIEIDGSKYKDEPKQNLQDGEFIKVIKVEKKKLLMELYKFSDEGYLIDPKLFSLAAGICY